MARNALGVSTNDVLPLNKPIIPLDKVTKYEHNPKKTSQQQHQAKTTPEHIQHKYLQSHATGGHSYQQPQETTLTECINQCIDKK